MKIISADIIPKNTDGIRNIKDIILIIIILLRFFLKIPEFLKSGICIFNVFRKNRIIGDMTDDNVITLSDMHIKSNNTHITGDL